MIKVKLSEQSLTVTACLSLATGMWKEGREGNVSSRAVPQGGSLCCEGALEVGSCDGQKILAVNLIQDGDRRLKWPRREGKEMSWMKVARMKRSPAKLSAEDPGIRNGDGNQPLLTAHSLGTRLPLPPPRSPEVFSQDTLKKGTLTLSCRNWKKRAAR